MFTSKQYRAKAAEYAELANTANSPNEMREYQKLGRSFNVLADNEQWLTDNYDQKDLFTPHLSREILKNATAALPALGP